MVEKNNLNSLEVCINFILRKKKYQEWYWVLKVFFQVKKILMINTKNVKFPDFTENIDEELIDPKNGNIFM